MNSLRARLLLAIGLIVLLSVGLTLAIGTVLTRREVERASLRGLAHQADLIAGREREALVPLARLPSLKPALARQGERVEQVPLERPSPYLTEEARNALRVGRGIEGTVEVEGTTYHYAARRVRQKGFVLVRPTRLDAANLRPYRQGLLLAALVAGLAAALVALILARAISRPVRRVAAASRSLGADASPEPVPVEGPDELKALAESFNDMAAKLARARAAERAFLLSVSHELKTPLTAIRGWAEAFADGAVSAEEAAETIAVEAARLDRLVQDVLDLARMNRIEFTVRSEAIDLSEVVVQAVKRHEAQAAAFDVELEAALDGPAPARGDADRVVQVVSNLVENALRVTPAGGRVRVTATPGVVIVEDTGPGLRPDDLPQAFERFYLWSRYEGDRPVGTGLGLAIVKELTEKMGGSVEVSSEPGRPTRFLVRLPDSEAVLPTPDLERAPV
jgi:two-component system sensor histidine kinase BaeS